MTRTVHDHSAWPFPSRWGADDQVGAGNLLTVERRLAALHSVNDGKLYDLSHEIGQNAPFMLPNQTPFLLSMWASWRNSINRRRRAGATNDAGSNVERAEMTMHVGTHIDALGHFSIGDRLYNGISAAEAVTDWGLDKLGIEHAPPMICRGLLLDLAGFDGGQFLDAGRPISPDDLKRAADAQGVAIAPGDIVLIRTGWGRFFGVENPRYVTGEPGIDVPAAQWLTRQDVVAIGADNMAVEVMPNPDPQQNAAGATACAGRGRCLSDRKPHARRAGARAHLELLLHPACRQVQGCHRLPGPPGRARLKLRPTPKRRVPSLAPPAAAADILPADLRLTLTA